MKITARNYAAQAERGLLGWAAAAERHGLQQDALASTKLSHAIGRAQHFVLPDGGQILDDDWRGMRGESLRLPFPEITVEYFCEEPPIITNRAPNHAPKRVVYAVEVSKERAEELSIIQIIGVKSQRFILVIVANVLHGEWVPCPLAMLIPERWEEDGSPRPTIQPLHELEAGRPILGFFPVAFCRNIMATIIKELGPKAAQEEMAWDTGLDAASVFELCEALTCSNVGTTIHQSASSKNETRLQAGKLPIYETRSLVIEAPQPSSLRLADSNELIRSSPRQHLRRGHIRRLVDRKIWVNSCVVGSLEDGRIDKNYRVIPRAA